MGKPFHAGQSKQQKSGKTRASDVFSVPVSTNAKGIMHPAVFPIPLAERLIKTFCPPGGTVLDCFAGSGTTCLAAKQAGRKYYGFDIVPNYVEIGRQRLVDAESKLPTEMRDFDFFHHELAAILEDTFDLGGRTTKKEIETILRIFKPPKSINFNRVLASLPEEIRAIYNALPGDTAA